MKKTLNIARDAILCTLISMFLILLNATSMIGNIMTTMVIVVFIGCYFQNKQIIRTIISCIAVLSISFIFINPLFVVIFILPSIILGFITSLTLKKGSNLTIFYILLTILFFGINFLSEWATAKFIMGIDFFSYIITDSILDIPQHLLDETPLFVFAYLFVTLIISILQTIVLFKANKVYKKKIMKLIKEED